MEELLYDKDCKCPVCRHRFTTKKIRTRGLRIERREDDFNVIFKDINPNYYYIWVCPTCGYSATEKEFDNITSQQEDLISKSIRSKWKERSYGGVRTYSEAEESFKMALLIGQILNKSKSYMAGISLRLAWLYRETNNPKEITFLTHALELFEASYQTERIDEQGLDEVSLAYLNGELNRRVGRYKQAVRWYSITLDHPNIKNKRHLQIKAREQWQLAKEQNDEAKLNSN